MSDLGLRVFALFLFAFSTLVQAQEITNSDYKAGYQELVSPIVKSLEEVTNKKILNISRDLSEFKSKSESHAQALERLIAEQESEIKALKTELRDRSVNDGMTFEEWAGILLASVAIILTALAVVIAIVSFYGYRKIINSANDIATKKSEEVTAEIVKEQIHETTKVELVSLFEGEKLDKFLLDAAGKVIYRGISRSNYNSTSDEEGEGEA